MDVETYVGWHTCSASFKKFIWHFQKNKQKKIIKCPQKLWNKSKAAALSGCGSTDHGIPSSWAIGMPAQLHCGATGAKIKHIFLIFLFAIRVSGNAEGKKKIRVFGEKLWKKSHELGSSLCLLQKDAVRSCFIHPHPWGIQELPQGSTLSGYPRMDNLFWI